MRISLKNPVSRDFRTPCSLTSDYVLIPLLITRKRKSDRRKRQFSHGIEIRARDANPASLVAK
jgi:hypothetical protein